MRDAQREILTFVGAETYLVGHSLDSDLRALKLVHRRLIDTSELYPNSRGTPFKVPVSCVFGSHPPHMKPEKLRPGFIWGTRDHEYTFPVLCVFSPRTLHPPLPSPPPLPPPTPPLYRVWFEICYVAPCYLRTIPILCVCLMIVLDCCAVKNRC